LGQALFRNGNYLEALVELDSAKSLIGDDKSLGCVLTRISVVSGKCKINLNDV